MKVNRFQVVHMEEKNMQATYAVYAVVEEMKQMQPYRAKNTMYTHLIRHSIIISNCVFMAYTRYDQLLFCYNDNLLGNKTICIKEFIIKACITFKGTYSRKIFIFNESNKPEIVIIMFN